MCFFFLVLFCSLKVLLLLLLFCLFLSVEMVVYMTTDVVKALYYDVIYMENNKLYIFGADGPVVLFIIATYIALISSGCV